MVEPRRNHRARPCHCAVCAGRLGVGARGPSRPRRPIPVVARAGRRNGRPSTNGARPDGRPLGERSGGCTTAQLRRFIKSRAYVPIHEIRRRFLIATEDDDVSGIELGSRRVFVGLPPREGQMLGELLRGRRGRVRAPARPGGAGRRGRLPDAARQPGLTPRPKRRLGDTRGVARTLDSGRPVRRKMARLDE